MSDLKVNSIAGAVLASVLGVMTVATVGDSIFATHYPEKAGYAPKIVESGGAGPAQQEGPPDFGALFADPAGYQTLVERGQRASGVCITCHSFDVGGATKTGPELGDVFGRPVASHAGFSYSTGMQAHGGVWTYGTLNEYLRAPSQVVRGTRMAFAGIRNTEDRVAVIAYLHSLAPNPPPLPAPLPEAASAEPADGAAPAEEGASPPAPSEQH